MFFELSKLLNFFLAPTTWMFLLLAAFAVLRNRKESKVRRRWSRVCLYGSLFVFLVFTDRPLFDYVKARETAVWAHPREMEGKHYKAALVMGGFSMVNPDTGAVLYPNSCADRLWGAVRLYHMGKVEKILISGDSITSEDEGHIKEELFLKYMEEAGVPRDVFLLEPQALNTRENAVYSIAMLKPLGIGDRDCLLITSASHMERSLGCFAAEGWHPDWYAVGITPFPNQLNHRSFYPSWEIAFKWQELLNEWIGNAVYSLLGYRARGTSPQNEELRQLPPVQEKPPLIQENVSPMLPERTVSKEKCGGCTRFFCIS